MKKYKSINEMLKERQLNVIGLGAIILMLIPILSILFPPLILPKEYIGIGIFMGVVLGFVIAWQSRSYIKLKRINGTFENAQIIKRINAEIEQTGNLKAEENSALNKVKSHSKIPSELEYFYKNREKILNAFLLIVFISIGSFLIYLGLTLIGALSIAITFYHIDLNKIKDIGKKEAQISIGNKGIYIKKFKGVRLVHWNNIQSISVNSEDEILELSVLEEEVLYEREINLKDYEIGNYDDFLQKINVYLKINLKKNKGKASK